MFCPQCGAEYRQGFTECADCGVALSPNPPVEEAPDPHAKTVQVFKTTDPMMVPIARSILDGAEIEYFVQGEEALGLMPLGAMAASVAKASLAARFHVFERDADTARRLLTEVDAAELADGAVGDGEIGEAEDVVESADE